jgi:chromosomal replication initiation ATPase DnaA
MTHKQRMLANVVAREFDAPLDFAERKMRAKRITTPKQVLSYFLYYKAELTLLEVSKILGYKEHSTILYNLRVVDALCIDECYKAKVDRVAEAAYDIYVLNKNI